MKNAQGIMLSLPKKQEVMVNLKQIMQERRLHIPYDTELINEMNVERYELTKTGQMKSRTLTEHTTTDYGHLHWQCTRRDPRFLSTMGPFCEGSHRG